MKLRLLVLLLAFGLAGHATANESLAKSKGCLACHAVDKKVVGPAFQDVAAKYRGEAAATATALAAKVVQGGKGNWGPVPMPPNKVSLDEAVTLVAWILELK